MAKPSHGLRFVATIHPWDGLAIRGFHLTETASTISVPSNFPRMAKPSHGLRFVATIHPWDGLAIRGFHLTETGTKGPGPCFDRLTSAPASVTLSRSQPGVSGVTSSGHFVCGRTRHTRGRTPSLAPSFCEDQSMQMFHRQRVFSAALVLLAGLACDTRHNVCRRSRENRQSCVIRELGFSDGALRCTAAWRAPVCGRRQVAWGRGHSFYQSSDRQSFRRRPSHSVSSTPTAARTKSYCWGNCPLC